MFRIVINHVIFIIIDNYVNHSISNQLNFQDSRFSYFEFDLINTINIHQQNICHTLSSLITCQ